MPKEIQADFLVPAREDQATGRPLTRQGVNIAPAFLVAGAVVLLTIMALLETLILDTEQRGALAGAAVLLWAIAAVLMLLIPVLAGLG